MSFDSGTCNYCNQEHRTDDCPTLTNSKKVLGIDVGGVIIGGDGEDTSFFSDDFLKTPQLPGAIETISRLRIQFDDTVIISKCGPNVERKTMLWMYHNHFHHKTKINDSAFYFCRKREEKAGIAKSLGVTHYVDNRKNILTSMIGVVPNLFLFAPNIRATVKQGNFYIVSSWASLERVLGSWAKDTL